MRVCQKNLICLEGKLATVWDTRNRCLTGVLTFKDGLCIVQKENDFETVRKKEILMIKEEGECAP